MDDYPGGAERAYLLGRITMALMADPTLKVSEVMPAEGSFWIHSRDYREVYKLTLEVATA